MTIAPWWTAKIPTRYPLSSSPSHHLNTPRFFVDKLQTTHGCSLVLALLVIPSVIEGDYTKKPFASIVSALKNNSARFQWRALFVKVVEKPRAPDVALAHLYHIMRSLLELLVRN
ncbi:hypothetical protein SAY86_016573 [Trapa natans]|uniref:Uncharacterized protein n=1 Tax=Trapa natans TaxID=22666 RepID=A0AAN7LAL3_TRANT|nr:hypothetical protein SAY86_016573 [Trapa natans]